VLIVRELQKAFSSPVDGSRVPVLDVPSLDVAAGEHVALIGGSGSGKTTLLHCLAGVTAADAGSIVYDLADRQVDVTGLAEPARDTFRGRQLGYVFQTHHLLPGLTARENVLLGMSFSGRTPDKSHADDLLARVGLGERLHHHPRQLSVGQQQRVAVARALANRPTLVLADEPTGALDPATADQVMQLMIELCREAGAALLAVTHDPRVAAMLPRQIDLADINRAGRAA
jgi:putative ABC transport system ATP-binding protein